MIFKPRLSIIIPAYNEEARLPDCMRKVLDWRDRRDYLAEIILVENGSTDGTHALVDQYAARYERVVAFHWPYAGKGKAVSKGMQNAVGDFAMFTDVDLSVPPDQWNRLITKAMSGYDVVIASREVERSERIGEPRSRHIQGRVFNWIVRAVLPELTWIRDTQCGCKLFRAHTISYLFDRPVHGWGFDIDVLARAVRMEMKVAEVPVKWYYDPNTRVKPVIDQLWVLSELFDIRARLRKMDKEATRPRPERVEKWQIL